MSYNLYVWEQPKGQQQPATLQEAGVMARALERTGLRPGANAISFLQDLSPELGTVAPDDSPVLVLGVSQSDRLQFIRRAVDAARRRGLTVLDDQLGLVFLPTGAVLPQGQALLWQQVVEQLDGLPPPLTKAAVRRLLRTRLDEVLGPEGFQAVTDSRFDLELVRQLKGGDQRVCFSIEGAGSELRCTVSLTVTHDKVAEIYDKICGTSVPGGAEWSLFLEIADLLGERAGAAFPVAKTSEVEALAATVARVVLPRLNEWKEIGDVDRVVNREARFPLMSKRFASLIVAALAGNPDFERLAQALRTALAQRREDVRDALERLIIHLRQLPGASASP